MPQWLHVHGEVMETDGLGQRYPILTVSVDLDYVRPALESILVGSPETSGGATTLDRMSEMFAVMA